MTISFNVSLIFLLQIIVCSTFIHAARHRRQIVDGTNRIANVPASPPSQNSQGPVQFNNIPYNPPNNPNTVLTNQQISQGQIIPQTQQQQTEVIRGRGFYSSPGFQPPTFTGAKPAGWFGTSYVNWVSNQNGELDKNKLAAEKQAAPNKAVANTAQIRHDGGQQFLAKIARQYASKGEKAFNFALNENREGRGSVCYNHDNFDGYVYGRFPCPLPASTGMNQLDQFCCGLANYQYCCNAQEFSQYQRGAFSDNHYMNDQRFPRRSVYSSTTKRILAIIIPIASFVVLTGIVILVVLYYKKFRKEQTRTRKPSGAIRLEDNYSIVPQDPPVDKVSYVSDEQ
ncbi:unnamed protein product [Adineta ricciae]|uniref:Shisa N-terminal domain-containing protein n=1 Tax=Adineta ricciae TaxID=249248 RepID=A0A815Q1R2_ADIRI|nr:unnamed protein product [Adineta ricciae]